MTTPTLATDPKRVQYARAAHLRELIEPWSLRKLEARTGISRSVWATRLNGETALSISDIEVLAPVIRMTPSELFSELLRVSDNEERPRSGVLSRSLPGLDSNQEPIGSQPDAPIGERLAPVILGRFGRPDRDVTPRPVLHIKDVMLGQPSSLLPGSDLAEIIALPATNA